MILVAALVHAQPLLLILPRALPIQTCPLLWFCRSEMLHKDTHAIIR